MHDFLFQAYHVQVHQHHHHRHRHPILIKIQTSTKLEAAQDVTNFILFLKTQANVFNPRPVFITGGNLEVPRESILVVVGG